MDALDKKLNAVYPGRVVRKDLLHRIKKGTNVPAFVLEFLLARYCASDDPDEVETGILAVFETLEKNYVRPDESNKAQSTVQQKGKHKFIDKVHVSYREKERRHWAEMENFGSRRIAIPEKFYRDNERLLEGGIWAEVTVGHNDIDEDDYAFYVEDLRPIQLSRFDADAFIKGRKEFSRDEWLDVLLRSIGLEPGKFNFRQKLHFLARLFPFVESNYNFIELGPRGTGKSYAFSEFSPYSTLVSQASTPTLFYNNLRRKVGLVGYWDVVAFDEVGRVKIKDKETVDILKSFMASGRFSRGVEVVANASLAFVGNIDYSIKQLVNSTHYDLFIPLPKEFDLAVMDRFFTFLPGWEMPKNSSEYLTDHYGFITDYLSEAFHLQSRQSRYDYVTNNCKFGPSVEGRDEMAIKRTIAAMLKLLHPAGDPAQADLEEYMAYAVEGRRRIKEQMNKRKHDDEYARVNLSYMNSGGEEIIVWCPESKKRWPRNNLKGKGCLNHLKLNPRLSPPKENLWNKKRRILKKK
jgi:ATP-dependent Lon protease